MHVKSHNSFLKTHVIKLINTYVCTHVEYQICMSFSIVNGISLEIEMIFFHDIVQL